LTLEVVVVAVVVAVQLAVVVWKKCDGFNKVLN
jgi:hypothetical protein